MLTSPSIGQISQLENGPTPLMESRGNPVWFHNLQNSFEVNYTRSTKLDPLQAVCFIKTFQMRFQELFITTLTIQIETSYLIPIFQIIMHTELNHQEI